MTIRMILLSNASVVAFLSLTANFLLIYLIFKRTPTQLRSFSRLMLIHCVSDILLMIAHGSFGALVLPLGTQDFLVLQGLFPYANNTYTRLLHSTAIWLNLTAVALLPTDFYYRYRSVCFNHELSTRTISIMVLLSYSLVWIYAFPLRNLQPNLLYGPSIETMNMTIELGQFEEWRNEVPSYLAITGKQTTMKTICNIFIVVVNLTTFSIIFFTSWRIHQTLKQRRQHFENENTKRLHKQVDRILITQALLPIIVICGPIITLLYCSATHTFSPVGGMYASLSAAWLTVIKPMATILSIESYRRFLFRKFGTKTSQGPRSWAQESTPHNVQGTPS